MSTREEAEPHIAAVPGRRASLRAARRGRRRARVRRLRPSSDRDCGDARNRARARCAARPRSLPAAPLLADATSRTPSSGRALVGRRRRGHGGLPRARAADRRRQRQARSSTRCRSMRASAWMPPARAREHAGWPRSRRPGDFVLTVGAGDVDAAVPVLLEALVVMIEERVPLARYTTLGTGGPARWFARPQTLGELEEALAFAEREGVRPPSSGSARTCSPPTTASTGSCSSSAASSPRSPSPMTA